MKPKTTNDEHLPTQVTGVRRIVYLFLAFVLFVLGMVGVVLPGLPTTPFLLFMSYFLIRTSPALHSRIINWPVVGKPLQDWEEKRGVRPHVKLLAITMVAVLVGLSLFSSSVATPMKVAIGVVAVIGVAVIWLLPTVRS